MIRCLKQQSSLFFSPVFLWGFLVVVVVFFVVFVLVRCCCCCCFLHLNANFAKLKIKVFNLSQNIFFKEIGWNIFFIGKKKIDTWITRQNAMTWDQCCPFIRIKFQLKSYSVFLLFFSNPCPNCPGFGARGTPSSLPKRYSNKQFSKSKHSIMIIRLKTTTHIKTEICLQ